MGLLGDVFKIGSSIIGGNSSKKASKRAQAAQTAALGQANRAITDAYGNATNALSPYNAAGVGALSDLNALLGISTQATPGTVDWASYVSSNPDLAAEWQRVSRSGQFSNPADYGQWHYQNYGQAEGRDLSGVTSGGVAAQDGAAGQAAAIANLQNSPLYESLFRNGEQAILQNAAATGGLRGGNIQNSLANFGRDTLSSVIQNQIANLSGVANNGQQAANSQANLATGYGNNLAGLYTQQGDVNAGGLLQRGAINANTINQVGQGLGSLVQNIAGAIGGGGIKF